MIQLEIGEAGPDPTFCIQRPHSFFNPHSSLYHSVSYSYTQQTQQLPLPHARAGGTSVRTLPMTLNQMALMCPQTAPHRQLLFNSVPVIHEPFKSIFVYLNPLYVSDKVSSLNINPALYKTVFLFLFLWTDLFQVAINVPHSYFFRLFERIILNLALYGFIHMLCSNPVCSLLWVHHGPCPKRGTARKTSFQHGPQGMDFSDAFRTRHFGEGKTVRGFTEQNKMMLPF